MTDFELEKILSDTLSIDYVPSPQLNKRIIESVKSKTIFPYRKLAAVAAALVIISGGVIAGHSNNFYGLSNKSENITPVAIRSLEQDLQGEQPAVFNARNVSEPTIASEQGNLIAEEELALGDAIPTFEEWITITEVEITPQTAVFTLSELPDDVSPSYTLEGFGDGEWQKLDAVIEINSPQAKIYFENENFKDGRYRLCADSVLGDTVYAEFEIKN